jgi:hypothetical protein
MAAAYAAPAPNNCGHLMYHRKHVLAIVEASGVEFRLHDLRRTFASIVNHHLGRSLSAYTIKRLMKPLPRRRCDGELHTAHGRDASGADGGGRAVRPAVSGDAESAPVVEMRKAA